MQSTNAFIGLNEEITDYSTVLNLFYRDSVNVNIVLIGTSLMHIYAN